MSVEPIIIEQTFSTARDVVWAAISEKDQGNPMFTREAGEAGWGYFLNQSLPAYLEGQSA